MKVDVQVQEHQLSDFSRSNEFNNFVGSLNQEVELGGCQSYANEVHNEGMFIRDKQCRKFY